MTAVLTSTNTTWPDVAFALVAFVAVAWFVYAGVIRRRR